MTTLNLVTNPGFAFLFKDARYDLQKIKHRKNSKKKKRLNSYAVLPCAKL